MSKIYSGKYELSEGNNIVQNEVRMEDIIQDENFNPRSVIDPKVVNTLMGVTHIPAIHLAYFPEISNQLIIVDGNHRYTSRVNNGSETISAIIHEYHDETELFKHATMANLNHGIMLGKEDRVKALARLITALDSSDNFKAASLARDLGGLDPRELRKINHWSKVVAIVGIDDIGYNISKGDVFYRLISKGGKSFEEFKILFEKFKDLTFNDLHEAVKKTIDGEDVNATDITLDKIKEESDIIESTLSFIGDLDDLGPEEITSGIYESDGSGTPLEFVDEYDDIYTKDIIEDVSRDLDFKIYSIEQRIKGGCKVTKDETITEGIKLLRAKIDRIEALFND